MLRLGVRAERRLLLISPVLLVIAMAGCGDDDDDVSPGDTVTVGIEGGSSDADGGADAGESADGDDPDDGAPASTHDIPSLEEVGRADFTHTIVAGDFLRSIADTYDVEIDDIVGANEWGVDGRNHLLLAGDVIYLPADAVMPEAPSTTAAAADTTAAAADATAAAADATLASVP